MQPMIEANPEVLPAAVKTGEIVGAKTLPDPQGQDVLEGFSALVGELLMDSSSSETQLPGETQSEQETEDQSGPEALAGGVVEAVMSGLQGLEEAKPPGSPEARGNIVPDEGTDLFQAPLRPDDPGAAKTGMAEPPLPQQVSEFQDLFLNVEEETAEKTVAGKVHQDQGAGAVQAGKTAAPKIPSVQIAAATADTGAATDASVGERDLTQILPGAETGREKFEKVAKNPAAAHGRLQEGRPSKTGQAKSAQVKGQGRQADRSLKMDFRPATVANGKNQEAGPEADRILPEEHQRTKSSSGIGERFSSPPAGLVRSMTSVQGEAVIGKPAAHELPARGMEGEIVRQVAAKIRLNKARIPSRASIRLEPASLGKLHVDLRADGHQVSIRMVAETHVVKDLLEANLTHLRHELQQQGMDLKQVEVFVGRDPGDGRQPETRRRPKEGRRFSPAAIEELEEGQAAQVRATTSFDRSGEVDTFA